MKHSQLCVLILSKERKELISTENIIKHPLLSNLITFISIYFLQDTHVSRYFFKFPAVVENLRKVEYYVSRGMAVYEFANTKRPSVNTNQ